jgi:hypothetical protein
MRQEATKTFKQCLKMVMVHPPDHPPEKTKLHPSHLRPIKIQTLAICQLTTLSRLLKVNRNLATKITRESGEKQRKVVDHY